MFASEETSWRLKFYKGTLTPVQEVPGRAVITRDM
jgi:hypothetical protein